MAGARAMRTIGLLGGMSGVATAEYYRLLNAGVNQRRGGHASAEILICSVDFAVIEACIRGERWDDAAGYLVERARRLERGGASFLLLATNTMHRVAPEIEAAVGIPLIHIVDVTAAAALAAGARRLGVLGTRPVMEADFYRERFARHGIDILVPAEPERAVVDQIIFTELTHGVTTEASRAEYLRIMSELRDQGADGIVLGCTEIGLLVAPGDLPGTDLYDTTALHVQAAIRLSLDLGADAS